jgi:ABC-type glycerol-3-phosphate transport system substrate-binding protein
MRPAKPVFSFDDPRTIAAFEFMHDLVAAEQAFAPNSQDTSLDGPTLFLDGNSATLTTGSWDIASFMTRPPDFEWTVLPMPSGPAAEGQAHTVLGGSSLFVTRTADDRQLAFDLAAHLIRADHSLRYAKDDGRLPPQVEVLDDPFFEDARYRVVVDNLPYADAMRVLAFPQLTEVYTDAIADILRLQAEPADALRRVQDQASDLAAADLAEVASELAEEP